MANAWTELTRPGYRTSEHSLIAIACLPLLVIDCSEPPAADRSTNVRIGQAAAGTALDGRLFKGRIGRFNAAGDTLAVVEGQELVLTSLADGERSIAAIDQSVADLVYADDGGLWLIGHDGASYWQNGKMQCSASAVGDSPNLLEVTDDRIDIVTEMYVDGGGVFSEQINIKTDCSVERGPKTQAIETAMSSLGDGRMLVARACDHRRRPDPAPRACH